MNQQYIVKPRDTLSKIAAAFGVTPQALAQANGIRNLNVIRVNQKLVIPQKLKLAASPPSLPAAEHGWIGALAVQFVDVLNNPIEALKIALQVDGEKTVHVTDSAGKIPVTTVMHRNAAVKVEVEKVTGGWKTVSEINALAQSTYLRLRSPKIMIKSELRPHEGPVQTRKTDKPHPLASGTVSATRSMNGHPVQAVALECPNKENLRLGANVKYRDIILAAAARSGFTPQAIAAIMNAEAATITTKRKTPVIDPKSGKQKTDAQGAPLFRVITGK